MDSRRKKVLIVDDHPTVREGLALRIACRPDLAVCGEAADLAEALTLAAETAPDLAIIDISLRTGNGLDLVKRMLARHPSTRILVWSMHPETLFGERALRAGALGYINKESDTDRLLEAIDRTLNGKIFVSAELSERLLDRAVGRKGDSPSKSPVDSLSDREIEVFQLLGQGLNTSEIAKRMCISPKTVETYRTRIKEKLNIRSPHMLILRAVQWSLEPSA